MTQHPTPETGVPVCYRHPGRESHIRCQRCGRPICPDCMRDAAVGFQCPDCVAEGARSTRSGRTAYGGLRPTKAGSTSMTLIGVNLVVFLMTLATGGAASRLVDLIAIRARGLCAAGDGQSYYPRVPDAGTCATVPGTDWVPGVVDGAYWQLLTSAFSHVQVWHIGFNMLALYVLGPQLEVVLGRARFLALYLLSALSGSAFVYWLAAERATTLGASGAIFGLMGALLVVVLKVRGNVQQILLWLGINAVITVAGSSFISWQGHLGGFVGGVLIAGVLVHAPRGPRRTTFQVAGLAAIAVVLALAIVARSLALA